MLNSSEPEEGSLNKLGNNGLRRTVPDKVSDRFNRSASLRQREILGKNEIRLNETFSDRQPRQDVGFSDVSGTDSVAIFSVCWWCDDGHQFWFHKTTCSQKCREKLPILTRLSARENLIEFCRRRVIFI